ncbi:MAG TPA: hypothetical protein VKX49_22210 [Bryobacteraceae bacterium]|nr:hypothetical protein [Bryobacteraceae bacterium]
MEEQLVEPQVYADLPSGAAVEPCLEDHSVPDGAPESTDGARFTARKISWVRLAYAFEFLLALLVVLTLWSEVGGQSHLDMMPWYAKLIGLVACAWCCVRFTAGLVEEQSPWNRRAVAWLSALLLVICAMAAITFYYHLQEGPDQDDSDETTATAMITKPPLPLSTE